MTETTGRRNTGTHPPLRVLFVCTANISRSPYAERRARQALAGFDVELSSAGTPGFPGRGMDPEMERLLLARGGDASGHVSRSVTAALVDSADLVLPFEFAHHMRLLDGFPEASRRIIGIGQFAAAASALRAEGSALPSADGVAELNPAVVRAVGPNSMGYDVEDPYRQGNKAATACADQIDGLLDAVLPLLVGDDVRRLRPTVEPSPPKRRWFLPGP